MKPEQTDYISLTYNQFRAPESKYPSQLVNYLVDRFKINENSSFLEIGCGRGDFIKQFTLKGLNCYGVDREISAQGFSKELEIKTCDISKDQLPFEDCYFDVVYHKSLIEHLYQPDNLMKESFRVLKPNGKLIILTPDWISQMKNFYEDITHCRPYDVNSLRDALLIFGFKNIIVEKFYQLPILWKFQLLKIFSKVLQIFLTTHIARQLTAITKIKFFRWSVELMVLGYGEK